MDRALNGPALGNVPVLYAHYCLTGRKIVYVPHRLDLKNTPMHIEIKASKPGK